MPQKRIGFVDYNLDNFHSRVYLEAIRGPLAARGYEVAGATAIEAEPSKVWAASTNLVYLASVEELVSEVDYFVILAPSNPETHLKLCQQVFPFGKPTFVDKTFAPDLETAEKIFHIADQFGVPVQTTSALRNTNIQRRVQRLTSPLVSMFITAGGSSFAEYGIHPVELAISCLGADVLSLMRLGDLQHPQFLLQFSSNRTAIIDFNSHADIPFRALLSTKDESELVEVDAASLFVDAASAILDFFDANAAQIDRKETLIIRRILDLAMTPDAASKFVDLVIPGGERQTIPAPHWKQSELHKVN